MFSSKYTLKGGCGCGVVNQQMMGGGGGGDEYVKSLVALAIPIGHVLAASAIGKYQNKNRSEYMMNKDGRHVGGAAAAAEATRKMEMVATRLRAALDEIRHNR